MKEGIGKYNLNKPKLTLNIVLIGENLSSIKYVNLKKKIGAEIGVEVLVHKFTGLENNIHQEIIELLGKIELTKQGIIFQLPLDKEFQTYLNQVPFYSDVDLLSHSWPTLLEKNVLWPTVSAIQLCLYEMIISQNSNLEILLASKIINLKGKTVAVVGQGKLVGSPTLNWLAKTEATIISINKDTKNPQSLTKQADIVISGVGVPNLINSNWLKKDSIIIDAGTSDVQGSLIGDVNKNDIPENCILCPSPGGIGPLTVLCLFQNLLDLAKLNFNK